MSLLPSLLVCGTGACALYRVYVRTTRMKRIFALIDAFNAKDPRGDPPQELVYGQRMTKVLQERYDSQASDVVQIACRSQHIGRWIIPRDTFPLGRANYLQWRRALHKEHARIMRELMTGSSFSEEETDRVCQLVGKQWDLTTDLEAMAVEDVAALVFLEYYFPAFYDDQIQDVDKMVNIIRLTWKKMSERGRQVALTQLKLEPIQAEIVQRALTEQPAKEE